MHKNMTAPVYVQVEEALNLARIDRSAADEYYKHERKFPANIAAAGLPFKEKIMGNYVHQVEIVNGTINITLGKRTNRYIAGKVLSMLPAIVKDAPIVPIAWVCGKAHAPEGINIVGNNVTSLDNIHLPLDCRELSSTQYYLKNFAKLFYPVIWKEQVVLVVGAACQPRSSNFAAGKPLPQGFLW